MDIHRSRFVPYPASAINALAFSHTSRPTKRGGGVQKEDPSCLRLAIGRANGNIEIWNPCDGVWVHETTLFGGKDRSIEGLAWTQEPDEIDPNGHKVPGQLRLFSHGYSSTVTEWNLQSGLPLRHSSGSHSEIWCLAAQPKSRHTKGEHEMHPETQSQDLAIGCADGTLAIYDTSDHGINFRRYLARSTTKKARALSIVWQTRSKVVAGFADGTISIYHSRTGAQIRSVSLGAAPKGGPRDLLVWALRTLRNGDLVIGDSAGDIRVYDGKNYSQLQRIPAHEADVLTLAVSSESGLVFSGSIDRRCATFSPSENKRLAKANHRRYHWHDVKAMAAYEGRMSVVVSGGIDVHPVVVPMRQFGQQYHLTLPIVPQRPPIASAPKARLIVSWWEREARIWHCPSSLYEGEVPKLLARAALKGDENISHACIDREGRMLALSTASSTRVFELIHSEDKQDLRLKKMDDFELPGARLVKMSVDGNWLALVTASNTVKVARVIHGSPENRKLRVLPNLVSLARKAQKSTSYDGLNGNWGRYGRTINQIEFSPDSRVLVVTDLAGFVDSWLLAGHKDPTAADVETVKATDTSSSSDEDDEIEEADDSTPTKMVVKGQTWIANPSKRKYPRLESPALFISFRPCNSLQSKQEPNGNPAVHPTRHNEHPVPHDVPDGDYRFLIVSAKHHVYEFDALRCRFTDWYRRNPRANFPPEFTTLKERAMGCIWDLSRDRERIWLYGSNWLFMFDLSKDMVRSVEFDPADKTGSERKRTRHETAEEATEKQKSSTGAGDLVLPSHGLGLSRKMRKITGGEGAEVVRIEREDERFEDENGDFSALNHIQSPDPDDEAGDNREESQALAARGGNGNIWWRTLKYRPILGIVEIGDHSGDGHDDEPPEVVLVERPLWDLDLPPRLVGPNEPGFLDNLLK